MTLIEMEKLEKIFFENPDNSADYNAYLIDKDLPLLNRVVLFWAKAQGLSETNAKNFSLFMANKALKEAGVAK